MSEILEAIKRDQKNKKGKYVARKYYDYKPEEKESEIDTYSNGNIHTVKINDKNFLYTNYFELIVNQKIDYLLSNSPELESSNYSNVQITSMLEDIALNASLDVTGWLHLYVTDDNKLDWVLVPDKEVIPVYDRYKKNIIGIIRYYKIDNDTWKIETWSEKGLKIEYVHKDKLLPEKTESKTHYVVKSYYDEKLENEEAKNLPFIPFIPLQNNKSKKSDLKGIKDQIDFFNKVNSGLIDNIDLFQEAIVKLSGFTGDTEDLREIRENMKKFKIVGLPSSGGDKADVDYMSVEIPVEARQVLMTILKENIFKISRSIDPDKSVSEGNVTNVVIKSKYASLDTKANGFEKQLKLFYETFIDYVNKFYSSNDKDEITFNRSLIFNESEEIDNCVKSMGVTSEETLLKNHPWVDDVDKEIAQKEAESRKNIENQQIILKSQDDFEKTLNNEDIE